MLSLGIVSKQATAPEFPTIFTTSRFMFDAKASSTLSLSGTNVLTWNDYYGRYALNRNGATTTVYAANTFNTSYPCVAFSGNGYLTGAAGMWPAGAASFTIFFVVYFSQTVNCDMMQFGFSSGNGQKHLFRAKANGNFGNYWWNAASEALMTTARLTHYVVCWTGSGTTQTGYINNVQNITATASINLAVLAGENCYMGKNASGANPFTGKIANVTMFSSVLSSTDRTTVYNTLKSRYGL